MSDSPQSPHKEVDQGAPSPDDEAQMNEQQDPQSANAAGYEFEGVKEQDRWLPIANARSAVHIWTLLMSCNSSSKSPKAPRASKADKADELDANIRNFAPVARIMKNALPDNAKIAKEAKECMQECVSEFISFITSEASEKCQQEKRKTVNGEDILFAMTSLGFENYAEALKVYLSKYREQQNQSNRDRVMDNGPMYPGTMMGDTKAEPGAVGEFGHEGNSVEGGADPNYMYGSQPGHNGTAGEGY
ncbi:histone-fold-containing protein [Fusarium flagelliforme]|uniref:histone-fold-containing protein n=1 Tax=Fusarium flagelliforme TaxID=2675880 RepID=UPI001E8DDC0B|nr:histone-fold-containing protein [Fusarium flagelliforme]KAH7188662.1 histone-fold-containing protein [Fusarium flagelliforme]